MPIVVTCPKCPTKLSAPDSAAGKKVRCPKCGTAAPVPDIIPAEEVPVVEAKVTAPPPAPRPTKDTTVVCCVVCNTMVAVLAKVKVVHCPKCGFANPVPGSPGRSDQDEDEDARPRRKPRRDADAEDEPPRKKRRRYEDDDDDPPPRRKARKGGGGGNGAVIAGLVIVGLLVLGGVGVGIYALSGKGGVFARKTPVPPGWKLYENSAVGVKGYFPTEPTAFGANVQGGQVGGPMPGGVEIPQIESMLGLTTAGGFGGRDRVQVTVDVTRFRTALPRSSRDALRNIGNQQFGGAEVRKVRWLGGDAAEMSTGGTLTRVVYTDKVIVMVQISGPNGARAKPEDEEAFFDNFELTR